MNCCCFVTTPSTGVRKKDDDETNQRNILQFVRTYFFASRRRQLSCCVKLWISSFAVFNWFFNSSSSFGSSSRIVSLCVSSIFIYGSQSMTDQYDKKWNWSLCNTKYTWKQFTYNILRWQERMRSNYFFFWRFYVWVWAWRGRATSPCCQRCNNDAVSPSSLFALPFCSDSCLFYPAHYYSVMPLHESRSFCSLFFEFFFMVIERMSFLTMSLRERKKKKKMKSFFLSSFRLEITTLIWQIKIRCWNNVEQIHIRLNLIIETIFSFSFDRQNPWREQNQKWNLSIDWRTAQSFSFLN